LSNKDELLRTKYVADEDILTREIESWKGFVDFIRTKEIRRRTIVINRLRQLVQKAFSSLTCAKQNRLVKG